MVRLKKSPEIKWAGVEFQPNLLSPLKPVRLGGVLLATGPASLGVVIIGRMPNLQSRPAEFEGVGDLMIKIASGWVDGMFKDMLEADHRNIFDFLAEKWRWNLYLIEPKFLKGPDAHGNLETIAKKVYQKFVGFPFDEKGIGPTSERTPRAPGPRIPVRIPPKWQLEEFKRQTLGQQAQVVV